MTVDPETAVCQVQRATGWTEDEARRFVGAVHHGAGDMQQQIRRLTRWAMQTERRMVMLDLLKRMPAGMIQVRWDGDDAAFRLNPLCRLQRTPQGWTVTMRGQ
jgi:hypothetical protein